MPDWVLQLVGMLLGAGAVYGGIRAEQRAMMRDILRHDSEIKDLRKDMYRRGVCEDRRGADR